MVIQTVDFKFDIERLQHEVERLRAICPFHAEAEQISLTHRPGALLPYYDGVGSLYDSTVQAFTAKETEFSEFNAQLRDWYFYSVYCEVKKWAQAPIGRVRLMRLRPRSCLSMHIDSEYRLLVPIFSNPQCFFVFTEFPAQHLEPNGSGYLVNTLIPHSVMNGHIEYERIHLVFSIVK